MAFWADKNVNPLQAYHFSVIFPGLEGAQHVVKSVTMPVIEASEGAYRMGNHVYKYPGEQRWQDVVITMVEDGDSVKPVIPQLYKALTDQGYAWRKGSHGAGGGGAFTKGKQDIVILQHRLETEPVLTGELDLDPPTGFFAKLGFKKAPKNSGPPYSNLGKHRWGVNAWRLKGAWIKSINFGQHDYSSDELITMEITVCYDFPEILFGGLGGVNLPMDEASKSLFE